MSVAERLEPVHLGDILFMTYRTDEADVLCARTA